MCFHLDINECDTYKGGCEYQCNNNPGSYTCTCPTGFTSYSHTGCKGKSSVFIIVIMYLSVYTGQQLGSIMVLYFQHFKCTRLLNKELWTIYALKSKCAPIHWTTALFNFFTHKRLL